MDRLLKDFQDRVTAAQDLVADAKEQNYRIAINGNGTVGMYHGTSVKNAQKIKSSGTLESQTFLSLNKAGAEYYGTTKHKGEVLLLNVDPRDIEYSSGTGEVYAPDGLVNINGIWQSPKR